MSTLQKLVAAMETKPTFSYVMAFWAAKKYLQLLTPEQFKVELEDFTEDKDIGHLACLGITKDKGDIWQSFTFRRCAP